MKFKDALSSKLKASIKMVAKKQASSEKHIGLNTTEKTHVNQQQLPEENIFADAIGKVKPLMQDTIHSVKKSIKHKNGLLCKKAAEKNNNKAIAQFHFSDEFEPDLNQQGPMKYVREDVDSFEVKNLRRGFYKPDLILDLHGLDQHQAKKELAALLYACQKEHAQCICIIHGIGSFVLKNKVPHWLVQHPDVMAFHQAPLEWGGKGAILALIELKDKFNRD